MAKPRAGSTFSPWVAAGALAVALGGLFSWPEVSRASVIVTPVNQDLAVVLGVPIFFQSVQQFTAGYAARPFPNLGVGAVAPFASQVSNFTFASGTVIGPAIIGGWTGLNLFPPFAGFDTFVGLDVVFGTDNFYGWVDFGGADGTVLKAYAFETTANTPITTGIPEPAPLTVLALGAVAVLATRYRFP